MRPAAFRLKSSKSSLLDFGGRIRRAAVQHHASNASRSFGPRPPSDAEGCAFLRRDSKQPTSYAALLGLRKSVTAMLGDAVNDLVSLFKAAIAACLGGAGLFCLWKIEYRVTPDVGFVTLAVLFTIVLALTSNRLKQVSGGGFTAEFHTVAKESAPLLRLGRRDVLQGADLAMVAKGGIESLNSVAERLHGQKVAALALQMGTTASWYEAHAVSSYLRTISAAVRNSFVIITKDDKYVAAARAQTISALAPEQLSELLNFLREAPESRIQSLPFFGEAGARVGIGTSRALKLMSDRGRDFLVLVDREGKPNSIVTRDQIIERLLLSLSEPESARTRS